MSENDFKTFATESGANVISQLEYATATFINSGFSSGISSSAQFNKVWRQASIIASMIAQTIVDISQVDVIDDGSITTIEHNFVAALREPNLYVVDAGTTNTIVVTLSPPPSSLSQMIGMPLRVKVAATNTGATTINVNSLGGAAVTTNTLSALGNSAIAAGGIIQLIYDGTQFQKVSP
jgi:hypothetical protein